MGQAARIQEPTAEQWRWWKQWVAERPKAVRSVAERFDPWTLYRMKSTGQRVTVASFQDHLDGKVTLTINVTNNFNSELFERRVFGIDPDELEPCELPWCEERVSDSIAPIVTEVCLVAEGSSRHVNVKFKAAQASAHRPL